MYRGSPSFNNYHDMISSYTQTDWPNWLLCLFSRRINLSIVTTVEATETEIVQLYNIHQIPSNIIDYSKGFTKSEFSGLFWLYITSKTRDEINIVLSLISLN
jgi:hypothetical protein